MGLCKIDLIVLKNELDKLKNEKERLNGIYQKITQNHENFVNLNLEGNAIKEIDENYRYGLERTSDVMTKLDKEISDIEYMYQEYSKAYDDISKMVGEEK